MILTNRDLIEFISNMKETCAADQHGGVLHLVRSKLIEAGIFDTMPEAALDAYRPCPLDWTALQIAYFDNGDIPAGRKRATIQRTKMRFGGNIKVWTRSEIDFSKEKLVSWQANIHLWTAAEAIQIADDLKKQKYIEDDTVNLVRSTVAQAANSDGSADLRYSIPLLKTTGTRWMKNHLVITRLVDGLPGNAVLIFPGAEMIASREEFADCLPNGDPYRGNAIRQARLARNPEFDKWATEIVN